MTKVGNPRCFQGFLRPGRAGPGGHGGQQLLVDHDVKLVLIFMLKLTLTPLPMMLMPRYLQFFFASGLEEEEEL